MRRSVLTESIILLSEIVIAKFRMILYGTKASIERSFESSIKSLQNWHLYGHPGMNRVANPAELGELAEQNSLTELSSKFRQEINGATFDSSIRKFKE